MSAEGARDEPGSNSEAGSAEPDSGGCLARLQALVEVPASHPLRPVPDELPAEVQIFVRTLRVLFGALGMSLNRLAALLHSDPGTVSRYLSGRRIPPTDFIEGLCKALYDAKGFVVTEQLQQLVNEQFLAALKVGSPSRYEVQWLTDLLEVASQEKRQREVTVAPIEEAVISRVEADTGEIPDAQTVVGLSPPSPRREGVARLGADSPYRYELSAAVVDHTSTVVGRDSQVRDLMAFSGERQGGYALVEAPAGFGKTTLVAELWRRHAAGAWEGAAPDLVGFSVRRDLGEHTAVAFLQGLAGQLATLLNQPREAADGLQPLAALWRDAAARAGSGRPLLLVVDGLDEIAAERPGVADLLPDHLPDFTHVIVTSRPNPQARSLVPPHHPLRHARLIQLSPLSVADIGELLMRLGLPEPGAVAADVREATRGEPLLARFAAEDVAWHGEAALISYRRERPADVTGYFAWQLALLEADASDDITWAALALLLAATGGLSDADLADALGQPGAPGTPRAHPREQVLDRLGPARAHAWGTGGSAGRAAHGGAAPRGRGMPACLVPQVRGGRLAR